MRKIYLIRHSLPNFPKGRKMCIGTTDVPLGAIGRMQSVLLAEGLKEKEISRVYCSDLSRSVETARYLTDEPRRCSGFREMDCGEWEGLPFDIIRQRWPEIYQLRGEDLAYPIPGAESLEEGQKRFKQALFDAIMESEGDIAVVGHATANKSFLCELLRVEPALHRSIPMDYASVTTLSYDGDFSIEKQNECFVPELTEEICKELLIAAGTPENVQAHCMAVRKQALRICGALQQAGVKLDEELIGTAAMLHDIARTEREHAKKGGEWLTKTGYPIHGVVVADHHGLHSNREEIDERAVLAIADRCIRESEVVSIEKRFEDSKIKCKTAEAIKMHEDRYRDAVCLKDKINRICGKGIIL